MQCKPFFSIFNHYSSIFGNSYVFWNTVKAAKFKLVTRFRPTPPRLYLYLGRLLRVGVFPLLLYCTAELCRAEFCKAELTMASLVSYSPLLASSFTTFSFISRSRPSAPRSRTTRLPYSCPVHKYIITVLLSCT